MTRQMDEHLLVLEAIVKSELEAYEKAKRLERERYVLQHKSLLTDDMCKKFEELLWHKDLMYINPAVIEAALVCISTGWSYKKVAKLYSVPYRLVRHVVRKAQKLMR